MIAWYEACANHFGPPVTCLQVNRRKRRTGLVVADSTTDCHVRQSLPRPPFTEEETESVAGRVYDFVWQRSASGYDLGAG